MNNETKRRRKEREIEREVLEVISVVVERGSRLESLQGRKD